MGSIHEGVWNWLLTCSYIKDLFFNFGRVESTDTILVPVSDDQILTRYIDGTTERRYTFSLVRYDVMTDTPNDTTNLDVQVNAELLVAWINEQKQAGNYPTLPEGCVPYDMAPAETGVSPFAAQDETQAKFIFQFTIDYLKTP